MLDNKIFKNTISGDANIKNERNKLTNNSVTKNNNNYTKNISKGKNKKKKNNSNNAQKLLLTNSKFNNDQTPSYNRMNIEKMYKDNSTEDMIAFVQCQRSSNKFVLYNVCTDDKFMSDHIIVDSDPDNLLELYVGKCIQFKATAYEYHSDNKVKYSLMVYDVKLLNISKPFNFGFGLDNISDINIYNIHNLINTISDDRLYEIVDKLALLLESYSAAMFGSKHFIISMIFNLFYMGSTNHELSTSYEYDIGLSKRMLVWIFSDVIYTLEKYRQTYSKMIITINDDIEIENAFTILHKRVIELCMFF